MRTETGLAQLWLFLLFACRGPTSFRTEAVPLQRHVLRKPHGKIYLQKKIAGVPKIPRENPHEEDSEKLGLTKFFRKKSRE